MHESIKIEATAIFDRWLFSLTDSMAVARIAKRLERVAAGNFGDFKGLSGGIAELRVDYGPGYRIYFGRRSGKVVILLAGGDKRTQARDIATAIALWNELKE